MPGQAPTWSSATTYYPGQIVVRSGVYYRCKKQSTNNQPPNSTYWYVINAGLLAQWTVKLNANGHIAGVGLMLDGSGNSEFAILANKFYVINQNSEGQDPLIPFIVGAVGGVSQVGINGDLIVDGSILADAIRAGTITADRIESDNITSTEVYSLSNKAITKIVTEGTTLTNSDTTSNQPEWFTAHSLPFLGASVSWHFIGTDQRNEASLGVVGSIITGGRFASHTVVGLGRNTHPISFRGWDYRYAIPKDTFRVSGRERFFPVSISGILSTRVSLPPHHLDCQHFMSGPHTAPPINLLPDARHLMSLAWFYASFLSDNRKLTGMLIVWGAGDVGIQVLNEKPTVRELCVYIFWTEILQPVIHSVYTVGLNNRVFVERQLVCVVFESIQEAIVVVWRPEASKQIWLID